MRDELATVPTLLLAFAERTCFPVHSRRPAYRPRGRRILSHGEGDTVVLNRFERLAIVRALAAFGNGCAFSCGHAVVVRTVARLRPLPAQSDGAVSLVSDGKRNTADYKTKAAKTKHIARIGPPNSNAIKTVEVIAIVGTQAAVPGPCLCRLSTARAKHEAHHR